MGGPRASRGGLGGDFVFAGLDGPGPGLHYNKDTNNNKKKKRKKNNNHNKSNNSNSSNNNRHILHPQGLDLKPWALGLVLGGYSVQLQCPVQ